MVRPVDSAVECLGRRSTRPTFISQHKLMQVWQDIMATAVVGTERQQLSIPPSGDRLGSLLAQLDTTDREALLLKAAALIALYRRAGLSPESDSQPSPEVCQADNLIRVSPAV